MDFFDRQAHARRQTRRLAWLFGFAILAVLVVNNLIFGILIDAFCHPFQPHAPRWDPSNYIFSFLDRFGYAMVEPWYFFSHFFHWETVLWISSLTLLSIGLGSYYKMRQLAAGGSVVAEFLGGRRISAGTADADEQCLRNVVEEMAIASGTPVPDIYILDNERGINAFAAGHSRDDVAIGITRGTLKLLSRDELQGIVAHEFSHILNGDTRLNMRLMGLAHGLFWPTLLGRVLIRGTTLPPEPGESIFDKDSERTLLPTAPVGVLFFVLGSFSLPFVRIIKSSICRQREWLADAEAVQFTRYPAGISGALKKVGGLFKQGRLDTPHAEVASHLYFTNYDYEPWLLLFSTHPPLEKRITAIDPYFDGKFTKVKMLAPSQVEREQVFDNVVGSAMLTERMLPAALVAAGGGITDEHIRQASLIRLALPEDLKRALRNPSGAANVVFALLLTGEESVRARQMDYIQTQLEPVLFEQFTQIAPVIEGLDDGLKLPVAEFAVPALREHDLAAHENFTRIMQHLLECDGAIDLFEYTLTKMVARQLRAHFDGPEVRGRRPGRVRDVLPECAILLSALAHVGAEDEAEARQYFNQGKAFLDAPDPQIDFVPRSQWNLTEVDAALEKLAIYHEPLRRNVLLACGKTVIANNDVNPREAELLHAIADALDCSMPSFVEAIRTEELAKEK